MRGNDGQYWFTYVVVLLCTALLYAIVRSPFGDALRAIRENRRRAEFAGLWVKRYEITALAVAGAFAGVAGALYAMLGLHTSGDQLDWATSAQGLIAALVGGIGSFLGPMAGALFYVFLQDQVIGATRVWDLVVGVAVVVVALVLPGGIAGVLRGALSLALLPVERALGVRHLEDAPGEALLPRLAEVPPRPAAVVEDGRPVLVAEGLRKAFGGLVAVGGVSLAVRRGSIHAVIGPNGSGKTTLFNLLTGLIEADAGRVVFEGRQVHGLAPWRLVRRGMGRSFQQASLFWALTSFDNVLLPEAAVRDVTRRMVGRHRAGLRALALDRLVRVGLAPVRAVPASDLSHGDQRSLELAAALAVEARLILLDEPTAGLSPPETAAAVRLIERIAHEDGLTVLFIEHDMSVVFGVADWITVLHRGVVLADGPPDEVRRNPEVRQAYLGEDGDGRAAS